MTIDSSLSCLFEPANFGKMELRNRFIMAPMTRNKSPGGVPNDAVANYYRSRAEGGVGLIITEGTYIDHPVANGYESVPAFHGEEALQGWKKVVDSVHAVGGKIIPQIWHTGAMRAPRTWPNSQMLSCGPSPVVVNGVQSVKELSREEIEVIVNAYAKAAADAERLGFDGVEIHGAHGYLIDQFFWCQSNCREDEYGGPLENRIRFAQEVVKAVRSAVSADFPVVFRFSQWKITDYDARIASNPDELQAILKPLADAGVDVFHASTRRYWEPAFEGSPYNLATWAKKVTGKQVITVGSVGLDSEFRMSVFTGEERPDSRSDVNLINLSQGVSDGLFDFIAVGRALLADPHWVNKVLENRITEISHFDSVAFDDLVT